MQVKPVILCGGSGTRLWPLSTPQKPKQFQALTGTQTMISMTSDRMYAGHESRLKIGQTLIIGSARHEDQLLTQAPGAQLILEPFGRNSAPAVAAACLASDPDDLILILPADHHIEKPDVFLAAIAQAQHEADRGAIVTFGIQPTHPATGYGYIHAVADDEHIKSVLSFVEKPPLETAKAYLDSGNYFWNAGIFLFKVSVMLDAFEVHAPEILTVMRPLISANNKDTCRLDPDGFGKVENISIDYAIMERAENIKVLPVDMGWSDVGGYDALWDMFAETDDDNVTFGPVATRQSERLFIRSEGPLVTVSGLKDFVIIAKPEVVMIAPRGDSVAVKALGAAAQSHIDAHSITEETSEAVRKLLWSAFETWTSRAWDATHGGFVESLTLDGQQGINAERRVRVQARQIYSFARAVSLGWSDSKAAKVLVEQGLNYLDSTCRHPDGGWVHRISGTGEVLDDTRDLYDHAFIMMAGAAAYEATGEHLGLDIAARALEFVDQNLTDNEHGGYFESLPPSPLRRANPHMHLLEAFLTLYQATQDKTHLDRATEMVTLFERHFFDPENDILREYFSQDWSPAAGEKGLLFEPGHHYEWATLLAMHQRESGRDTLSWQRRLIATADRAGRDTQSGFAHNCALPDRVVLDDKRRIWHQLEMFRTRLIHPDSAAPGTADRLFTALKAVYFDPMPTGTWLDETDAEGQATSKAIPASILYHLVTAFTPALRS